MLNCDQSYIGNNPLLFTLKLLIQIAIVVDLSKSWVHLYIHNHFRKLLSNTQKASDFTTSDLQVSQNLLWIFSFKAILQIVPVSVRMHS